MDKKELWKKINHYNWLIRYLCEEYERGINDVENALKRAYIDRKGAYKMLKCCEEKK